MRGNVKGMRLPMLPLLHPSSC